MQNPTYLDEPSNEHEQLLRQEDVAKILDLSPRTLEAWRHKGGGPRYLSLTPRCVRYRRRDLLEWIEARLCDSTSET